MSRRARQLQYQVLTLFARKNRHGSTVYMWVTAWRIAATCRPSSLRLIINRKLNRPNKQVKGTSHFLGAILKCLFRFYDSSPSDASFTCIIRIIILKCRLVFQFPDGTEGGASGRLFIDLFYLGPRSEVCARGLCVPIQSLVGCSRFVHPRGPTGQNLWCRTGGTLNTFRNEKRKHAHAHTGRGRTQISLPAFFYSVQGRIFSETFIMGWISWRVIN